MLSLIITGGIATGKTTFGKFLLDRLSRSALFDCDACVHELLTTAEVARIVTGEFGRSAVGPDGLVNRSQLREIAFGDPHRRSRLEALLHPLVRDACLKARTTAAASDVDFFLADVPLFYEAGFDVPHDGVIAVAVDSLTQRRRVAARSPDMSQTILEAILRAQLPVDEKARRARWAVWNAGGLEDLAAQADLLSAQLTAAAA